jgi:hypothetical protein
VRIAPPLVRVLAAVLVTAVALACAGTARAQTRVADPSLRDAEQQLRSAARDTIGRGADAGRLDTLGVALLQLGRFEDATRVFDRALAIDPGDAAANAGLGRIALCRDTLAAADTLLTRALARERDPGTVRDLFALRLRQGRWADAAELAEGAGQPGRREPLLALAERTPCLITAGPDEEHVPFAITFPVPCVRVRIDGESVLLAIDTGTGVMLLDDGMSRRARLQVHAQQTPVDWMGRPQVVTPALAHEVRIGHFTLTDVPAGILDLRKYGLTLNPRAEPVVGVIGVQLLRAFRPTLDYRRGELVLRRPGASWTPAANAIRVPFEVRGESDLFVRATMAGGRTMAMQVHSGFPECGVAAADAVFGEVGLRAGSVSKVMGSASSWMQGNPWARVNVPLVTLGGVSQGNVPGWSLRGDVDLWRHGIRSDGFLSHEMFRGWRVTFDWAAHQMVFEPKP